MLETHLNQRNYRNVCLDRSRQRIPYSDRSANHPVSRRLPSRARPRPHPTPITTVPAVPVVHAVHAVHAIPVVVAPHPPQPIIAPPPPPHLPPAQRELIHSDDAQTPPHNEDTKMSHVFSDNDDGHGFDSNYYPNLSDDAPTPPEIDDTDTENSDTDMTESFADNGDGFAQQGFVEDMEDYQTHSLSDGDNSMYPTNLPVPKQGDGLDSVAHLLHQLDIDMSPVSFC